MLSKIAEKVFGLQGGEKKPVLLLLVYSFFMGAAIAVFYTSTTSLLLNRFDGNILPYAYIAGGLFVYILSELNRVIQAKFRLSSVLLINIGFLLISTSLFILLNYLTGNKWLIFLLFVWVRIFTFIHGVSFWAVAVKVFDLRQGKRLFGLISSGEVVAAIFSQFSIPLLLNLIKTEDLLYIGIVEIAISVIFISIIGKNLKQKIDGSPEQETNINQKEQDNIKSNKENGKESFFKSRFKIFFETKYNKYIFFLALLPMFGMYFADYIFFTQSREVFPDKEVLTRFIGIFLGFSAILELTVKSLLTGRLVSKYGMKVGLIALPSMLILGFGLPSIIGTIAGQGILFFSFISAGRLFMRIVRVGINDPVFQILYQPIDKSIRTKFQNQVEGQPKAIGNILAGIVLIILTSLSFINIIHITYFYVGVILLWLRIALNMYREYKRKVREEINLESSLKNTSKVNTLSKINSDVIEIHNLSLSKEISWLDDLLKLEPSNYDNIFYKKLCVSNKTEKLEILKYIIKEKLPLINCIIRLYLEETDAEIKKNYYKTLKYLFAQSELSLHQLENLANSSDKTKVLECARWAGYSKRFKSYIILEKLIDYPDELVTKSALLSAGLSGRRELLTKLIENLFNSKYSKNSYDGFKLFKNSQFLKNLQNDNLFTSHSLYDIGKTDNFKQMPLETSSLDFLLSISDTVNYKGDNLIGTRDIDLLTKRWSEKKEMKKIIRTLGEIGGKYAIKWLRDKINFSDYEIRHLIVDELIKSGYKSSSTEIGVIQELIENELKYIIWIMRSIKDINYALIKNEKNPKSSTEIVIHLQHLINALENDLFEKKEAIFDLLSLIYNPRIIKVAKERIEEGGSEAKAFGIEMLEMTLNDRLKDSLISLFDIGLNENLVEAYHYSFPELELKLLDRLEDIIMKDYNEVNRWTKVCAIECVEKLNFADNNLKSIIAGLIIHKDRFIAESSLICLRKLDKTFYDMLIKNLMSESNTEVVDTNKFRNLIADINLIDNGKLSRMSEIVRKMKNLEIFQSIIERYRLYLVQNSQLIKLKAGNEFISLKYSSGNNLYILIEGKINVLPNKKPILDVNPDNGIEPSKEYTLSKHDIIFSSSNFRSYDNDSKFIAVENTEILRLDYDYLSEFNIFWNKDNLFEKIALKLLYQIRKAYMVNSMELI